MGTPMWWPGRFTGSTPNGLPDLGHNLGPTVSGDRWAALLGALLLGAWGVLLLVLAFNL